MSLARTASASVAPSALTGILLLVAGYQIVPFMDAIAKWLSSDYPVLQISWARFFFHFLFMAPLVFWRYGLKVFRLPHQGLQVLRGGFLLAATICFFTALKLLPMADTLAMVFISPMIVTLLSPWLLKERFGWRRLTAVLVGFLGALIIVRPGFAAIGWGTVAALSCGLSFSFYVIATRKLAGTAPPLVTLGYTAIFGCVALSIVMLAGGETVWVTPDAEGLGLMAGIGLCAAGGHFLVIKAYEYAEASLLAPFGYSEMVATATLGYLVFGDFPDLWTWVGIAVIVASGVYIALRERKLRQAPSARVTAAL